MPLYGKWAGLPIYGDATTPRGFGGTNKPHTLLLCIYCEDLPFESNLGGGVDLFIFVYLSVRKHNS